MGEIGEEEIGQSGACARSWAFHSPALQTGFALLLPLTATFMSPTSQPYAATDPYSELSNGENGENGEEVPLGLADRARQMSADGRWVVFSTDFALDAADENGVNDIYLADCEKGSTHWVSRGGEAPSLEPSITSDGAYVVFWSYADELVDEDRNGLADVFLARVYAGADALDMPLLLVSTDRYGPEPASLPVGWEAGPDVVRPVHAEASGLIWGSDGHSTGPSVSDDGEWVSFTSLATNLVPGDANLETRDVFLAQVDVTAFGVTSMTLVSTDRHAPWSGDGANGASDLARIDRDGRGVVFESMAADLVPDDANGIARDRFRAQVARGGAEPQIESIELLPR